MLDQTKTDSVKKNTRKKKSALLKSMEDYKQSKERIAARKAKLKKQEEELKAIIKAEQEKENHSKQEVIDELSKTLGQFVMSRMQANDMAFTKVVLDAIEASGYEDLSLAMLTWMEQLTDA